MAKTTKTGNLGRGLGAILKKQPTSGGDSNKSSDQAAGQIKNAAGTLENVSRETSTIKISLIEPNASQPRKNFDQESLKELSESIKEHGVLQPILVKKKGQLYEIVVGERRWRASKLAGLKEIPAIVKDMDSREAAEAALIENIQREDLDSVEEARAYKALIDEYDLTQDELAKRVSKNRSTITNSLRLLQLDEDVLELLANGELSAGHARALLAINGKRNQYKAAREIINNGLNVRQTEKLAKAYNSEKAAKDKKQSASAEDEARRIAVESIEKELTDIMNTKVSIRSTGKTKGRIEIEFYSDDELNNIIDRLR